MLVPYARQSGTSGSLSRASQCTLIVQHRLYVHMLSKFRNYYTKLLQYLRHFLRQIPWEIISNFFDRL